MDMQATIAVARRGSRVARWGALSLALGVLAVTELTCCCCVPLDARALGVAALSGGALGLCACAIGAAALRRAADEIRPGVHEARIGTALGLLATIVSLVRVALYPGSP